MESCARTKSISEHNTFNKEDPATSATKSSEKPSRSEKWETSTPFRFFCKLCNFKTKRQSHLRKHSARHDNGAEIYNCSHCLFKTLCPSHLQKHKNAHKQSKNSSGANSRSTSNRTKWKSPIKNLKNFKNLENFCCKLCEYETKSKKNFERHSQKHEEKRLKESLKCSCGFVATTKHGLERHAKVHTFERPFQCSVCDKTFKRKDGLKAHALIHEEWTKEHQCSVCNKVFRLEVHLKVHKKTHMLGTTFLCETCGARFRTQSSQQRHIRTIHEKPGSYECHLCHRLFNSGFVRKRHTMSCERKQQDLIDDDDSDSTEEEKPDTSITEAEIEYDGIIIIIEDNVIVD